MRFMPPTAGPLLTPTLLICLALGGIAAVATAQSISRSPAFSARQLTAPPTDGWITNGGNL